MKRPNNAFLKEQKIRKKNRKGLATADTFLSAVSQSDKNKTNKWKESKHNLIIEIYIVCF